MQSSGDVAIPGNVFPEDSGGLAHADNRSSLYGCPEGIGDARRHLAAGRRVERMEWARRTLSRWGHGLGAVEPGRHPPGDEEIPSTESPSAHHAGKDDPLKWKQLPVPLESSFAMADAEAALREIPATNPSNAEPIFPPNRSDVEPAATLRET